MTISASFTTFPSQSSLNMPVTRTQTGHLPRRIYDNLTLQINSFSFSSPLTPKSTTLTPSRSTFQGQVSPRKISKPTSSSRKFRKGSVSKTAERGNKAASSSNAMIPEIIISPPPEITEFQRPIRKEVAARFVDGKGETPAEEEVAFLPKIGFEEQKARREKTPMAQEVRAPRLPMTSKGFLQVAKEEEMHLHQNTRSNSLE